MTEADEINDDVLSTYYQEHFPLKAMVDWLSYGEDKVFQRREFSFTLRDDIYKRFLAFNNAEELRKGLISEKPHKIDIGAVYTGSCKHRLAAGFKEVQRELVFDIDISDYDDVRSCCQGALVCRRCWPLMAIAVKILKRTLNDDFGWTKLLFVFSGRRGIHCWVNDYQARHLDKEARVAVANYCQVTVNNNAQVNTSYTLHPMKTASLGIIDDYWDGLLQDQDFFNSEKGVERLMEEIKVEDDLRETIRKDIEKYPNAEEAWQVLLSYKKDLLKKKTKDRNFIERIKLSYCYPRIDIKVTEGFNHLLKAPFSVHPKTGKICIPFLAEDVDNFDLDKVPTILSIRANPDELKHSVKILQSLVDDIKTSDPVSMET